MSIKDKTGFLAAMNEIIPVALREKLKALITKFDAAPPVNVDKTMKTKDGAMTISVAGEPVAGAAVMDITSGAPIALVDGTYELEDGSSITVASGVITAVTPAATPAIDPGLDMGAKFSAQFAAQATELAAVATSLKEIKAENKELKQSIADITELNKYLVEFVKTAIDTPVKDEPVRKELPKPWDQMSGREKAAWKRENPIK